MVLADDQRAATRRRRVASPRPSATRIDIERAGPTRADALRRIAAEVSGRHDLAGLFEDVIDEAFTLFGVDRAGLWLYDAAAPTPLHLAAHRGLSTEILDTIASLPHRSATAGMAALRAREVRVLDPAMRRTNPVLRRVYRSIGVRAVCYVPLVFGEELLGLLVLYHREAYDWSANERDFARAFGDHMATAIGSARLAESSRTLAGRLRSIAGLAGRLSRFQDVEGIAWAIVAEAARLIECDSIRVYRVDPIAGMCEPVAFQGTFLGVRDPDPASLRVAIGEGLTGWVAANGRPIRLDDAAADPRGRLVGSTTQPESMLVVPMSYADTVHGVIVVSALGRARFDADDETTLSIFAAYAAQALVNASSMDRLRRQQTELELQLEGQRRLLEVNERLLSTLDQQHVLETIADGLRSVVHYDNLTIYRADHQSKTMSPVLTRERHAEQVMRYIVPFGRGLMGWAVEHLEPVLANDALGDPRAMQIPGTPADPEALAIVPLVSDGEVIGSMNISRVGGPENYFTAADFELVKLFAGQASIALRNADTHFAVSQRADTDALTGQGNHGAFQRTLGELVDATQVQKSGGRRRRAAPQGTVSLLMMDLDRFKGYNDRLGHPAGDALLHAVGTAIYGAARSDDRVFRYGGDEFALVLPGVDAANAMTIGDRVRRAVARLTAQDAEPVTISVGVATLPGDAADKNDLIAGADTALYYGKQSGGDRVVAVADVPREMRDLRGTLDQLARTALLRPDEASVSTIAQQAVRLSGATQDSSEEAVLEALLGLARALDARQETTRGHADRVGNLAARMATELGLSEEEVSTVELAGRLHDVDLVSSGELQTVRSMRGASDLLRWYRLAGDPSEGPIGAQLVSVANAYDSLMIGGAAPRRGRAAAVAHLRSEIGQRFRAEAVEALATVVSARQHKGERRRGADSTPVEGAA
jgi:diguanylate cyclase (GGDEF)-like protein